MSSSGQSDTTDPTIHFSFFSLRPWDRPAVLRSSSSKSGRIPISETAAYSWFRVQAIMELSGQAHPSGVPYMHCEASAQEDTVRHSCCLLDSGAPVCLKWMRYADLSIPPQQAESESGNELKPSDGNIYSLTRVNSYASSSASSDKEQGVQGIEEKARPQIKILVNGVEQWENHRLSTTRCRQPFCLLGIFFSSTSCNSFRPPICTWTSSCKDIGEKYVYPLISASVMTVGQITLSSDN